MVRLALHPLDLEVDLETPNMANQYTPKFDGSLWSVRGPISALAC